MRPEGVVLVSSVPVDMSKIASPLRPHILRRSVRYEMVANHDERSHACEFRSVPLEDRIRVGGLPSDGVVLHRAEIPETFRPSAGRQGEVGHP